MQRTKPMPPISLLSVFGITLPVSLFGQADRANRVEVSFRSSFNIGARFSGPSAAPSAVNPGDLGATGINRSYDDGYVFLDSEGNAGGLTWNWGYQNASQLRQDGTLHFHTSSVSDAGPFGKTTDDPNLGFEISWARHLFSSGRFRFGVKGSFGFTDVEIRDNRSLRRNVRTLTDVYPLNGIISPGDPSIPGYQYRGQFDFPGPLIDDTPLSRSETLIPDASVTSGNRRVESSLFGWKLGPWMKVDIGKGLSAEIGGGFAFAYADSSFSYREETVLPTGTFFSESGRADKAEFAAGGYVEIGLLYQITDSWSVSSFVGYQRLENISLTAGNRAAELDLKDILSVTVGVGYSF